MRSLYKRQKKHDIERTLTLFNITERTFPRNNREYDAKDAYAKPRCGVPVTAKPQGLNAHDRHGFHATKNYLLRYRLSPSSRKLR